MKSLFTISSILFCSTAFAQNLKPLPKQIMPPSIHERNYSEMLKQIDEYNKNSGLMTKIDTSKVQYDELDGMPILKTEGKMPNHFQGSEKYKMPIYIYDEKQKKEKL